MKDDFKKDSPKGLLYDETGRVDLPIDENALWFLNPGSRNRKECSMLGLNFVPLTSMTNG